MHKNGARCSLQYQPKQAEIRPNFVYHAQPPVAQCPFDPGIMTLLETAVVFHPWAGQMYHCWLYARRIRGTSQTAPVPKRGEKQVKRQKPLQKLMRCNKEIEHAPGKDATHGNSLLAWRCVPLCGLGRGWVASVHLQPNSKAA